MERERIAKFTLSDGTIVFVAYRRRRNENRVQRLRNLIKKLAGKNIQVTKVKISYPTALGS